ncbi:MAG: TonB-dependent receptor [Prosthecobacter sp.]|jgi:iron complex outermembrane receptor protein|uniref:TonB-dependent receptor family protein n=1 Tax=Prosthecobacter sp. TaxID=1965333 RepID=UPI001A0A625E|nr:TonB-dependent receptor [Prosthecobacter sp.]MBE2286203.1 TonB-dependent receptor [Prosthecobacter sp.]
MKPFPFLIFLSLTGAAHAQTAAPTKKTTTPLKEIVITADKESPSLTVPSLEARKKQIAEFVPGGAGIVDAEDYKLGRATTLKDALDFAPGVFIQERFGAEEARLSIRGSGISRTFHGIGIKLLQDGSPVNLADGSFDMQTIEPLSAQYVEVYRGANALQYGSTTLGGAINFISHTGYTASPIQTRFEMGSFGTYRGQISSGGVTGPVDYYASLTYSETAGFREHSQQGSQRFFTNIGYQISPTVESRFYLTYVHSDSELPGELTRDQMNADPQQAVRISNFAPPFLKVLDRVDSNWRRDIEMLRIANRTTITDGDHQKLTISTFWSWTDLDHPILFWIDQNTNDIGTDLRYENTGDLFGHKNSFTIGTSLMYGIVQDNRFLNNLGSRGAQYFEGETQSWNLDFYLQNKFSILDDLHLVTGTQVSYASRDLNEQNLFAVAPPFSGPNLIDNSDRQAWWGFSPKLGMIWDVKPSTQVYFNASRSFEPPTFGELTDAVAGNGLVKLDPQTATTLELGTRGTEGRFNWDVGYYYAWLDNELLQYQVIPGVTQTVNAARTIHQGIEASLSVDLFRGIFTSWHDDVASTGGQPGAKGSQGDRLMLQQNYLWNNFHFDRDSTYGNNRLPGIPEHYYRAQLLYTHPCGFYAGPNLEWVPTKYNVDSADTLDAGSYALFGFKFGYRTKKGLSFFIEGRNLTDQIYAATTSVVNQATAANSNLFSPGNGRAFYAGVEFKW